jgi:PadR family transcriptional regulator PadR
MREAKATVKVLGVFLEDPGKPRYGYELMKLTRLGSGTLYPVLARLESAGWLTAGREDAHDLRRPPRTYYTVSAGAVEFFAARVTALAIDSTAEHEGRGWQDSNLRHLP